MGNCGCSKNRKKTPLTAKQISAIRDKAKASFALKQKNNFKDKLIKARFNICEKCPHSVQNDRDKKYNIRICHKQNRPIDIVAKNLSSECPIGNFKATV